MMRFVACRCSFSPQYWRLRERQSPLESNLWVVNSRISSFTAKLAAEWRGRFCRLPGCIIIMKEQQRESKWVKVGAYETDVCECEYNKEEGRRRKCGGACTNKYKMQNIVWTMKEMLGLCSLRLSKHFGVWNIRQDQSSSRIAWCGVAHGLQFTPSVGGATRPTLVCQI